MMNGSPPSESFSAVEKNVAYVGYSLMLATTTFDSSTSTLRPARMAEMAQARPQGPAPTIRRSAGSLLNDLVAARPDAHVRHARLRQLLHAIEVLPRRLRECVDLAALGRGRVPPVEPFVDRLAAVQQRPFAGELVMRLAADLVARADRELVDGVEDVELRDRQIGEAIHARRIL